MTDTSAKLEEILKKLDEISFLLKQILENQTQVNKSAVYYTLDEEEYKGIIK